VGTVTSGTALAMNATPVYGSDQVYPAGSTTQVFIPVSAYSHNKLIDGLLDEHNQDGTHSDINATSITATTGTFTNLNITGTASTEGWSPTGVAVSSVTNNGAGSYDLTMASTMASILTPGMRLKSTRTVAAPDQCADLESGSSQYFSKASPAGCTFTDDYTIMAWIKLESYKLGTIINRRNASTEGWDLVVTATGALQIGGYRIASNNRQYTSYQSLPLDKWVHVAATMNHSANTHTMYVDGVLVPAETTTTGTITAIVQGAVDLRIGSLSSSASNFFDGEIAQAAVFSAVLDQATIRSYMSQGLTGSETNIVSAYSFDNSLLDLSANDNDLTASGGALATATDSPFGGQADGTISTTLDYGIVTKVATTTVTVQTPEGCTIPTSGGVTTLEYSIVDSPFNFPKEVDRWTRYVGLAANTSVTTLDTYVDTNLEMYLGVGSWNVEYRVQGYADVAGSNVSQGVITTLSTDGSTETNKKLTDNFRLQFGSTVVTKLYYQTLSARDTITNSTATTYTLLYRGNTSGQDHIIIGGQNNYMGATCAYL
jgi:hypothetical protein